MFGRSPRLVFIWGLMSFYFISQKLCFVAALSQTWCRLPSAISVHIICDGTITPTAAPVPSENWLSGGFCYGFGQIVFKQLENKCQQQRVLACNKVV